MGAMLLPDVVRATLEARLDRVGRADLATRAASTSAAYRAGAGTAGVVRTADDALAYALVRMPATYAAVHAVLTAALPHLGVVTPTSLADIGSGTGAATIAAIEAWRSIEAITLLEANAAMADLGSELVAATGRHPNLERRDATTSAAFNAADIVLAAYVLVEMDKVRSEKLVQRMLAAARDIIVLVEPGTPAGFVQIRAARDVVTAAGWHIAAPCPQGGACPLVGADWCHFKVRLARTRAHMQVKGAEVPFEDEPFSYLVASRAPALPAISRVLRQPELLKSGAAMRFCNASGEVRDETVSRRDPRFKAARKLRVGDAWSR